MSEKLNSHNVVYGFILDRNPKLEDLPPEYDSFVAYTNLVTISKGVIIPVYQGVEFVDTMDLVLFGSYPKLTISLPSGDCEDKIIIHLKSATASAGAGPTYLSLKEPDYEEADQVNALATIFGKKAGWVSYPA